MKKLMYIFCAAAIVMMASCKQDEVTYPNRPASDAAGLYVGTWTVASSDTTFGEHGYLYGVEGTLQIKDIEIEDNDSTHYMGEITIYRGELPGSTDTWTKTSVANIVHAGEDIVFNNDMKTNPMGAAFAGRTFDGKKKVRFACAFADKIPDPAHPGKKKNAVNSYVFEGEIQK
ncbi:MAG: hypothetical protein MJZ65_02760 [Paludibacteraceae bacterium]|nr:hypothetical protein [Paludibacteraceae bacterium]